MRTIYIFIILVIYILLQFAWWSYLLVDLNNEVFEHRIENISLKSTDSLSAQIEQDQLLHKLHQRRWMVVGEGLVFLGLLGWGSVQTLRSFRKEMQLARMQKNFLLSVTHEFKSPLASIKLYLQTIAKHPLDKEKELSFINKAIADTERLDNLLENALLANRVDHEGYTFNKEEINFSALLRLLVQKYNSGLDKSRIEALVQESLIISADKLAITLLVNNLIENAIKYSLPDSTIIVELVGDAKQLTLRVIDEGRGIPDSEKGNVFRKFYRIGNEETRNTKGTGLGLYLVKYITESHNGKITIRDNKPRGSIFEIKFPRTV
jgi:two-component system, OmpR family, phosphate regulon sensor histidine kinase PhoR